MEGWRLVLKDGTIIEEGRAGYDDGTLTLYFSGYSFLDAAVMMNDPAKTEKITFQFGEEEAVYTGFTKCNGMIMDSDGVICVFLERGES